MANVDRCICCGDTIPEGRMVCPRCEHMTVCDRFKATGGMKRCEHFKEERRARWKYYHKQNIAVCTNCSFERDLNVNFGRAISCPNCGVSMDEEG